jgi:CRISPR system Cascade subunit CasD
MQAWGVGSRFTTRSTGEEPSKSAVIGLLAAACGRRRTDPIEDLAAIRFGVRIDQPGRRQADFQTALRPKAGKVAPAYLLGWPTSSRSATSDPLPLSQRYYLADAKFVVGLEADNALLEGLRDALLSPVFPLYLGRRAFPAAEPIVIGFHHDLGLRDALFQTDWRASDWWKKRLAWRGQGPEVFLDVVRDELPGDPDTLVRETVRDVPLSFSPERREYGWRTVVHDEPVAVINDATAQDQDERTDGSRLDHDPMALLGGN